MNREIKFRQWDEDKQEMSYTPRTGINTELEDSLNYIFEEDILLQPLMQYTGLKDKNGKEIYEGDICSYYSGGYDMNERGPVIFESVQFIIEGLGSIDNSSIIQDSDYYKVEVIGNIYENPELLEDKS